MLVLSRKENQEICVGDQIRIRVLKIKGNTIRLGIEAPREVRVVRGELESASRRLAEVTVVYSDDVGSSAPLGPRLKLMAAAAGGAPKTGGSHRRDGDRSLAAGKQQGSRNGHPHGERKSDSAHSMRVELTADDPAARLKEIMANLI